MAQSTNGEWKVKSKCDRDISIWEDRKRWRERQEEGGEGRKKRRKERRRQEKRKKQRKEKK